MPYSPQLALLEAVTCALMLLFYFWHSWHYDRLQSMCWWKRGKATQAGLDPTNPFNLLMRFIYWICLPIYIVQAVMIAYIKYQVGYQPVQMGGFPVPYTSWSPDHIRLIYVSYYLKALGWSGEGIVHLEELAFWVFLIHLKDTSPPWFRSAFFRTFVLLSAVSSGTLVSIVAASKPNVLLTQSILMTVATGYNTLLTCAFFWVFSKFPRWLTDLKKRGAPAELIIRLHGFGTLNQIRMITRLIFTVPIFALSADGLMAQPVLNRHVWVVDLIVMTSAVAFAAQGSITLLIFLPRDLSKECGFGQVKQDDKSSQQPLLNRTIESGCVSRLSAEPFKQQPLLRPPSPTTSGCSPSEKHKSYSSDMPPISHSTGEVMTHPCSPSDANSSGNPNRNSNLNNNTNFHTQSALTRHGRDLDRSSFVPQDLCHFCPRTSRISVENSHGPGIPPSPSTSRSPNFLPSTSEFNPCTAPGNAVPFPISSRLTHFPRYFAPSECRAFESCDGGSSKSLRTISRSFTVNQALPVPEMVTLEQYERLDAIHPAIRNFKSPIDISSAWFPETPEKENIS